MKIIEYRVPLPLTVDEFQVAQCFAVANMSVDGTGGDDGAGVEVITTNDFDHTAAEPDTPARGHKGRYSRKLYKLGSKLPAWLQQVASAEMGHLDEESWNAYPYCLTQLGSQWLGDSFHISVESLHLAGPGTADNVFQLSGEELAKRKVKLIDIAEQPAQELGGLHPRTWKPKKVDRGPLVPGWQTSGEVRMCAYKLVRVKFAWGWGISAAVEKLIVSTELQLFRELHLKAYLSIDGWHGMSLAEVHQIEAQAAAELRHRAQGGKPREVVTGPADPDFDLSPVGLPPSTSTTLTSEAAHGVSLHGAAFSRTSSGAGAWAESQTGPWSPGSQTGPHATNDLWSTHSVMTSFTSDLERSVMSNSVMWRRSLSSDQDLERSTLWQSRLGLPDEGNQELPAEVVAILGKQTSQADVAASMLAAAWSGVAESPEVIELDRSIGSSVGSFVLVEGEEGESHQRPEDGLWVNSEEASLDPSFASIEGSAPPGPLVMDGSYMLPVGAGAAPSGGRAVPQDGGVRQPTAGAGWVSGGLGAIGRKLSGQLERAGLL